MELIKVETKTLVNADNITEAVHGLDIFTKNWCMDCYMTKQTGELTFNCDECEFVREDGKCSIKTFVKNHKHDYPLNEFGSMGALYTFGKLL